MDNSAYTDRPVFYIWTHFFLCACGCEERGYSRAKTGSSFTHTKTRTLLHPLAGLDDEVGE